MGIRIANIDGVTTIIAHAVLSFSGCKDDAVTTTKPDNFRVGQMKAVDFTEYTGNLILDTVKILIKDIKLNVNNTSDTTNFKTGPYVLFLGANSNYTAIGSAYIPVGTYDKLLFEIHKLTPAETVPDPEFAQGDQRFTVIVKGHYNGVRFVFKSDKSAKQKLDLPNPLTVTSSLSNVTLLIKPQQWFADSSNRYFDPQLESNRNLIENNIKDNIKSCFKVFMDNNYDGIPDPTN